MARRIASLLFVWILLMGPALCVGGLIEHACSEDGNEIECEHEESCPKDVCSNAMRACERESQVGLDCFAAPLLLALPTWETDALRNASTWVHCHPLPPDRSSLPFAESDRPQLI